MNNFFKALLPIFVFVLSTSCKSDVAPMTGAMVQLPQSVTTMNTPLRGKPPPKVIPLPTVPTGLEGEAPIASEFSFANHLHLTGGTGALPKSMAPDVVGAFRFTCTPGQLSYDDPIVFPRKPGAAHLHQFFGNTKTDAYSTYRSLRQSGESSCMSSLNRSAYWMPAMLDGVGSVVRPDYVTVYYKRRPQTDPKCDPAKSAQAEGICVDLPNGLNFVFGYDMVNPTRTPTGSHHFDCAGPTARSAHYPDIETAVANCPVGNRLGAIINAPRCWDGKTLNHPDGRSHVNYASYGSWGYLKCPATHPYVIPAFTMGAWYTVDANLKTWKLSSDAMNPSGKRGSTFHADFMMAWDPEVKKLWHANCINKMLDCSNGVLGNGQKMNQVSSFTWNAAPRLVAIPQGVAHHAHAPAHPTGA